jgi:hypothetical protein
VVAAEHEWKPPLPVCRSDEVCHPAAREQDLAQVPDALVSDRRRLGDRCLDVAEVDIRAPELLDPRLEPGVPDRGRPHVDAAPARAEVERRADHGDRLMGFLGCHRGQMLREGRGGEHW